MLSVSIARTLYWLPIHEHLQAREPSYADFDLVLLRASHIERELLWTRRVVALVDELLVVDDGSSDATAMSASAAGARVVPASIY